jgi:hypothetical protein
MSGPFDKSRLPLLDENLLQGSANQIVSRFSNIGSSNPNKGSTARSLFYEAAKRTPGKYGNFLFYSLGSNENNFIDAYYRSENREYNTKVSSVKSKNPSASFLVAETVKLQAKAEANIGILKGLFSSYVGEIVGGDKAPYYWKDFLYCKHYGTIPNNYMVTLRRYPTPVLDNLSVPTELDNSDSAFSEGVGRPVAQAITWLGGNTGNSLNEILSFTTGINWNSKPQTDTRTQEAFSKGFLNDAAIGQLRNNLGNLSPGASNALGIADVAIESILGISDQEETSIRARRFSGLRDKAKDQEGLLGEYIWTSVDVVMNTYTRGIGLKFEWKAIKLVFEYELTSVGEVNSKAAMLDIMGNLLSIGTNYGNFLTPDIRYDSKFKNFGFPGGNAGLELYYRNPAEWLRTFAKDINNLITQSNSSPDGNSDQSRIEKLKKDLEQLSKEGSKSDAETAEVLQKILGSGEFSRFLKQGTTANFIENYQMPLSFLTGAPIGEWHLTVGNPCNPIAMIGNLVCTDLTFDFTENLGPDDFPTGVKATFTLEHGRDRERGEIESIFNRGDGRLYQSVQETSANQQSFGSVADTAGNVLSYSSPDLLLDGLWNPQLKNPRDLYSPGNP